MSKLEVDWNLDDDAEFKYARYTKDNFVPDRATKPKELVRYSRDDEFANYTLEIDVTKLSSAKKKQLMRLIKGSQIELLKGNENG